MNEVALVAEDATEEVLSDQERQQIKSKSVSGALSFLLRTAVLQVVNIFAAVKLSEFLSPEDFGIYGFVTQIIGLLIFFSDIGLAAALVQKRDEPSTHDYRTAFTVQQLLAWVIVLCVLGIAQSDWIETKLGFAGILILLSLAISFPLASLKTIPSIILERKLEFNKLVVPQILEQLVFQGVLLGMLWQGSGIIAYAYAILIRSVIGVLAMWMIQPWKIGLAVNKTSLKLLLSFGAKFQLNDFLARIKDQLFFLVLGYWLPIREFGFIQWSKTWSMFPYNLTVQNVMSITFPTFSRLQKHPQLLKQAIEKSLYFITLLIFPLLVGMAVFVSPLTLLFSQYQKWQPAIWSFVFFTLSIGWAAISTPLVNTLNAVGRINDSLKLMVVWTSLTWILTPVCLYFFGFNGVALAAFLISCTSFLPILYVKKLVPIEILKTIGVSLLSSVVMALVGILGSQIWSKDLLSFLTGIIVVGGSYGLSVLAFGRKQLFAEVLSLRSKKV